ncbi:zincin-like metallopeptidase domain-containing protein [Bernardetia sp. OM2101]|uniref:zincin-like metallopeptidase domain-containing protein n=1 Tax=Bernardetia sp. OM2101 TaxID=3344876 RepID=UPI0035D06B11
MNRKSVSLGRAYDDVRTKGILLKDGITYNRQKPITKMLKGKEITISFAFNRIVKGFYGIIEAENLQPSHSTGVQNPFHFLPEAQPRNRSTSQSGRETPQLIARNLRPAEIIEGANAYTGAPIANLRGEVIQGNGRADTLKIYYSLEPNGEVYKNYFVDGCNANFLGFSARTIKSELAKFKKPILGRFCDVSDEEFIQLGQFQAKDLEAVSSESSDTKARVNRISETDLAKMIDALLRYDKGDDSLTEIIRNSNALAYFVKAKVLRADELEKYTKNGQANAQGTEFVRQFLLQFLFEQGKDTKTSQKFENLPHHTQKGVEKSLLYVLKVHCYADCDSTDHSITKEVSNAIGAAYDFLQQSTFNFPAWVKQTPVFEPSPKDRFSPLELELAKVFSEGKTQKDIVDKFKKYAYYATDRPATMLEKEEKALSKNEALQKAFSISLSGLGCTSSCACQKKKVLNGCECDNEKPTSTPKTEDISFNTKDYKYQLVNESNPKKLRLQSIGLVAGRAAGEIKQGDYLMWNFGEIEYVSDIKSETPKMLVIQTVSKKGYTGERKLLKSRLVCILEKKITSTPNEVEKEPYQMTFNTYMHLDKGYKKDFNRFINVEKEVEKERIFDKEKRAKAISWREKQYKILLNTTRELLRERHKHEVEKALSEGKTVPSEVLKDYPDLQQKPTSIPNETEDFELQLAIAKMKMLKLKAKALQLDDLDGLYGLECIYDDTELGGLDGLDGKDVYEIVNEKILETIQQGNLSWRQTWKVKSRGGAAANYDSKRAYTGANFFLLNFILPLMGEDFEYPYFLTFKQIQARKGKIKKGSKGYPIFYYNIVRKHNGKKISEDEYKRLKAMGVKSFEEMRFLKYYTVFNIAAVEDVEFDLSNLEKSEKVNYEYEAIEAAEKIYYNMPNKPKLKVDTKAYYSPSGDYVGMPPVVTFESPQNFYSVLYHEIVHSTKHASRLNDKTRGGKKFGDKEYALEELVAELGACYLCAESGILFHTIDNSAAYLSSWNAKLTKSIQEDKTFFLKAAARAQRASNYILDYDKNGVPAYQRNEHYEPIPLEASTVKTPTKVIKSTENEEIEIAIAKMKMLKLKATALQL